MRATWTSQRMESSRAFFIKPFRLFEKVTWRLLLSSIRFSTTFFRPIQSPNCSLCSVICLCLSGVSVSLKGRVRIRTDIIYKQREGKRWDGGDWLGGGSDDFHLTRVPFACLISLRLLLYAGSPFLFFPFFYFWVYLLEERKAPSLLILSP
jgi:hypothetical protein